MENENVIPLSEQLSEDLKSNESLKKFENANAVSKGYVELESKLGSIQKDYEEKLSKTIELPGEDANNEIKNKFYSKLGRPEKAENYPEIAFEGLPEDFKQDDILVKSFQEAAYKTGLTNEQYKAISEAAIKQSLAVLDTFVKQDKKAEEEAITKLTSDWGGETKYKERIELARRLIKQYGSDKSLIDFLEDTRLGSYTPLVRLLGDVAVDIILEETTFSGTPSGKRDESKVEISPVTGQPLLKYDKSPELG